ncbi:hypothetical protein JTE90_007100 [Oedothorax gibbosus]|uniref:Uncharacterized protein n=1 Tax=Oedothorax gibbosus TaxID=931172 RepID=A0AAV6VSR7_9ARAC|nr:hypothetical protein JTE90_007100 [Oedothorax gibbosus]
MESYARPSDSGDKCARRLSMDWNKISKCANGDEGNRLLHEMAGLTNSLTPRLHFVPWINVNKVHTDNQQMKSLYDLKGVVCDSFGVKHSRC